MNLNGNRSKTDDDLDDMVCEYTYFDFIELLTYSYL